MLDRTSGCHTKVTIRSLWSHMKQMFIVIHWPNFILILKQPFKLVIFLLNITVYLLLLLWIKIFTWRPHKLMRRNVLQNIFVTFIILSNGWWKLIYFILVVLLIYLRVILGFWYLQVVDLLAERHLIHQIMIPSNFLTNILPTDWVQHIE